ncbi:PREDICTED: cannabidiolic acid synthase-like 1 [Camelina sativa]|uniref:Cannabidiolic acid synthase-like 1 n=1 Tax=Camelina sativa TaxID=90675 RepID=A0ABM0Y2I7_CAMSA|nr:PREDICTED: cannabidiolic acid synthase-like 1 [Camelina sativa]
MELSSFLLSLLLFLVSLSPLPPLVSAHTTNHEDFLRCLSHRMNDNTVGSKVIHTSKDSSFFSILDSSIQNPRFSVPETPKPVSIITPVQASDVQAVIRCARLHGIHVRIRSAGHAWEGLSYVAYDKPFVIIDLRKLRSISLDVHNRTGWVQTGATTGELYFEIGKTAKSLAFPASIHPTVGVGGQFSGGGYGTLLRKYGLAADNIIDALVVDASGRILDRQAMGEDYFWAIRGGGGSSFGVVLSWKIQLVEVPSTVTVFKVKKTSKKEAVKVINKWQYVADKVTDDLFISVTMERSNENMVHALFTGLYLGSVNDLVALMGEKFPELTLEIEDCKEMSWIESVLWFADFAEGESLGVLANRKRTSLSFKGKDDFVQEPIPEAAVQELWKRMEAPEARLAKLILTPFGGRMSEIAEYETPFPHREGNLYEIQYLAFWREEEDKNKADTKKYLQWVQGVYDLMTPYVSKSPRGAYVNFLDMDLGMYLGKDKTKYDEGKSWGVKYFKNNFERLVRVKTSVDPTGFFCNEQSIPLLKSVDDI